MVHKRIIQFHNLCWQIIASFIHFRNYPHHSAIFASRNVSVIKNWLTVGQFVLILILLLFETIFEDSIWSSLIYIMFGTIAKNNTISTIICTCILQRRYLFLRGGGPLEKFWTNLFLLLLFFITRLTPIYLK